MEVSQGFRLSFRIRLGRGELLFPRRGHLRPQEFAGLSFHFRCEGDGGFVRHDVRPLFCSKLSNFLLENLPGNRARFGMGGSNGFLRLGTFRKRLLGLGLDFRIGWRHKRLLSGI